MSLVKPTIYDGSFQRQAQQGDVVGAAESITLLGNSLALTVLGSMLAAGIISGNPTAAAAYTLDSAANILAALTSGPGNYPLQNGTTFRVRHLNTTAFVVTYAATANTGVTLANGVVNASSVKDFLITVVNGQPPVIASALTTNASAIVSGVAQATLAAMTVGMVITNAVAGLQGATVIAINLGAGTFTASANANATNATAVAVNLSPVITVTGIGQGLL